MNFISAVQNLFVFVPLAILSISLIGCSPKETVLTGRTMGTTYSIKLVTGYFQSTDGLQEKIDARLDQINQSMSTYSKDSEISRFNRWRATREAFSISEDFYRVMTIGQQLFELSGGAWDATVEPLINLWGFGPDRPAEDIPTENQIKQALTSVGFQQVEINGRSLTKTHPDVTLDLGSIAKGYGVDRIADLLRESGYDNFLVEIGGEVYAAGLRKDLKPWRVGINRPQKDAPRYAIYQVVSLSGRAMATSGDYRNFIERNGQTYSHIIDPRTGYPVANGVVSATVVADNCTFADGLATALMVMGAKKGLQAVNRLRAVECLIIVMKNDGSLVDYSSDGFGAKN